MSNQCPVRTQMQTMVVERVKETISATVKRPQKEILLLYKKKAPLIKARMKDYEISYFFFSIQGLSIY